MTEALQLLVDWGCDTPGHRKVIEELAGYGWDERTLYGAARQLILFAQRREVA